MGPRCSPQRFEMSCSPRVVDIPNGCFAARTVLFLSLYLRVQTGAYGAQPFVAFMDFSILRDLDRASWTLCKCPPLSSCFHPHLRRLGCWLEEDMNKDRKNSHLRLGWLPLVSA